MIDNELVIDEDKAMLQEIRRKREAAITCQKQLSHFLAPETVQCAGERKYGICPTVAAQAGFRCAGLGAVNPRTGSMMSRVRTLQRNAAFNQDMLEDHRRFIKTRQQLDEQEEDEGHGATEEMIAEDHLDPIGVDVSLTWNSHNVHTPQSASSPLSHRHLHRPQSAYSPCSKEVPDEMPARRLQRPLSACTLSSAGIKEIPENGWHRGIMSRPVSACTLSSADPADMSSRRTKSRPSSANSISGRFAAIEANLRRNKDMMQVNRQDIDDVIKKRQEKAEKQKEAMAREMEKFAASGPIFSGNLLDD